MASNPRNGMRFASRELLRILALPYTDHPDYRDWRPSLFTQHRSAGPSVPASRHTSGATIARRVVAVPA